MGPSERSARIWIRPGSIRPAASRRLPPNCREDVQCPLHAQRPCVGGENGALLVQAEKRDALPVTGVVGVLRYRYVAIDGQADRVRRQQLVVRQRQRA